VLGGDIDGVLARRGDFEAMVRGIARHRLRPQVDRVFGFDEVPEARPLRGAAHFGKMCIRF
jgi:NADPH:quinone reductase-like Zn-dependent oxidoreductase